MPQDAPLRSDPRSALPAGPARSPERLAVDIALHLALLAVFAYLALDLFRPFIGLALWTAVIAATLHPAYRALRMRLGGRARLAAALVTLGAVAVVFGPIAMLAASLVESAEWLTAKAHSGAITIPTPPQRVLDLPLVGRVIASNLDLARTNSEEFLARYGRALLGAGEAAARPAIHAAESAGVILVAVALAGFLLVPGERLGVALQGATRRFFGERGVRFVDVAGATVRNVARGVIGVAVIQALAVGVALILAGVPAAGVLTMAALVLAIVQIGVLPVVLPVIAWAWFAKDGTTAALLTAYLIPAALIDLPLKPLMLGKALTTPALVIVAGVVAGTVSYGLIGLFLGPILLAIAYEVVRVEVFAAPPPNADPTGEDG